MKTKTETKTAREIADAETEAWKLAATREAEAARACTAKKAIIEGGRLPGNAPSPETRLEVIEADLLRLRTEDEAREAQDRASRTLDAAECSEGDTLAIARDPASLQKHLRAGLEAVVVLEQKLARVRQEAAERFALAMSSERQLAERRAEQGAPPPVRLPADRHAGVHEYLARLDELIKVGTAPKSNAEKIAALVNEEIALRAGLERQRLERLEREEDKRAQEAARLEGLREDAKTRASEDAKLAAQAARVRKENEDLAAAHRARSSAV